MGEFKSFYKTVGGNEGNKCHYPTRLDTYGCGCGHDCSYCYAKALLSFRHNWSPENPSVANIEKVRKTCAKIPKGQIVRLGGMTDCIDYSEYTLKHGGYRHLPLESKLKYLEKITGFKEVSVCDDVDEHYDYFKDHFNPNPNDCCNLRAAKGD